MKLLYIILISLIWIGGTFFWYTYFFTPSVGLDWNSDNNANTWDADNNGSDNTSMDDPHQKEVENSTKILNSAIITSNPSLCEQISIPEMKQVCIEQSNLSLATTENDPKICEALSGTGIIACKDQVYFQIAESSGKLEDCKMIQDPGIQEKCTQEIELKMLKDKINMSQGNDGGSKINCDGFSNELAKEQCNTNLKLQDDQSQLKVAVESQNSWECETISSQQMKQDCYDAVYFTRAKSSQSTDGCNEIANEDFREHCKNTVWDLSDSRLFEEAILEQSTKLCEGIRADAMKKGCIDRIRISEIIKTGKKEDCATLDDQSLRQTCEKSF